MQETAQPIVIPMEDAPLHTAARPFCADMTCDCHRDSALLDEYLYGPMERGDLTIEIGEWLWYGGTRHVV